MKVALTVIRGPEKGRVMEFEKPRGFIIGRATGTDFRLSPDDPYVSRRHVFLEICPPACRLRDLGSTNPPHVNGVPVTERELNDGDTVELGYTQLKVSISFQASTHIHNCRTCGQPIELLPGEPDPDRCASCMAKARPSIRPAPAPAVKAARCSGCNADLSKQANNDGRAEELQDVAVYACEKCLPSGDQSAGSVIGDYEVRRLLGEGGMGVVYMVYQRATARVLALKQLRDLKDPLLIKRFEREIRLQKGLTHRNILRSIETGIDGKGIPYLVTEYVAHGSLDEEVARCGGRLEGRHAIHVIREVLNGLEYLHSQSIIHRDIKPQNILLHQSVMGNAVQGWPKLADFGLAVSYARAGGTRLTKPNTSMGTLMFMPPEQVRDAGKVREQADTYAVGVMLYYLLTGRYSFDFPTPVEILEFQKEDWANMKSPKEALRALMQLRRIMHPFNIILSEKPTPIRERVPSIQRKLAEVVDRAVRKDAKARFQSAAEFRSALKDAAQ